jgi:hypothetical protein
LTDGAFRVTVFPIMAAMLHLDFQRPCAAVGLEPTWVEVSSN